MAYCVVIDNPNGSAELYEQVIQLVAASGDMPPKVRSSRSQGRPRAAGELSVSGNHAKRKSGFATSS